MVNLDVTEIHVYSINLKTPPNFPDPHLHLTEPEIARGNKFKSKDDRSRYIMGRAWLRKLLSSYLSIKASDINLTVNQHGKPELDSLQNVKQLRFNLSHSGDWIVYSFCLNSETGIDIELINRNINHLEIAEQFCTSTEICYLKDSVDQEQLVQKFFRIWTRKEALLKAFGTGLTSDVKNIEVLTDNISIPDIQNVGDTEWVIKDINLNSHCKTAVACSGKKDFQLFIL